MAWVAFDRAIKSAEMFGLPGPVEHWRALRAEIHADVCDKGWNAKRSSFVQSYGSNDLDASLLLLRADRIPASPTIRAIAAPSRRSSAI